ncbi:uncharacterized protein LOC136089683 [Hydra vulgaris]|uniref:Uncharacterized protein LOC136089683 n=1 Tax=Hydra vulgaris TaxID=6087 RepID=A0ABM4DBS0_HYDVU
MNLKLINLEECFLFQYVCEPTFRKASYESSNILDLIITIIKEKIISITHSAPLGNVKQGHQLLKCRYRMNDLKSSKEHKKPIILYQKGNYELFSSHFNNVIWEIEFKGKSSNEVYDLLLYHYNCATELFIARINYQNRRNKNKWITPELKNKMRTKNKIWLSNKRYGWNDELTKNNYNKLKIGIKNIIKNSIKQLERTIASKFNCNPNLLYKYINEKKSVKTQIQALENENGEIILDQLTIATELNKYFHSVCVDDYDTSIIELHNIPSNLLLDTVLITHNDVQIRLKALDKSKSVGFDFVHPYILKECSSSISYPLYLMFKKSIKSGTIPDKWKKANVMTLFKKGSKLKASNYRPVSLTLIPCKVLEKIIADYIMQYLTKNNLLSKKQHGFMKNKSCTTNLLEHLDILTWIVCFLANRKQQVVLGESVTDWVDVLSGVLQGSVLGPFLFLVFINDLPENFINECRLYADDNKIFAPISSQNDSQLFQNDINKLEEWSTKWKLGLNFEKFKSMYFGSNYKEYSYFMTNNNTLMEIEKSKLEKDMIPNLEFSIQAWSPYYTKDVNELEKVQRRATKMIPELRHLEYKRLEILDITTLETRRLRDNDSTSTSKNKKFISTNSTEENTVPKTNINNNNILASDENNIIQQHLEEKLEKQKFRTFKLMILLDILIFFFNILIIFEYIEY